MSGLINIKHIFNLVPHVMHNFALKFAQASLIRILSLCDVVCSGETTNCFSHNPTTRISSVSDQPFNGTYTTDPTIRLTFM